MRRTFLLAVIIALLCQKTSFAAESIATLVSNNNTFAFDLYAKINSGEDNIFFSPYSISTCLAMTYAGARGETASQMSNVFHFADPPAELPGAFAALKKQLPPALAGVLDFNVANGLWAQKSHAFLPDFLAAARSQFEAKIEQVNFLTGAGPARVEINSWVSDQTRGKITNLLPQGAVNPATRLVLVNAIYFKGRWEKPFRPQATTDAPFHVSGDRKVQAKMMTLEDHFNYGETADWQWLEMPYATAGGVRPLSMMVLLPKTPDGLPKLEHALPNVDELLAHGRDEKVRVFLPRFKTTRQLELSGLLRALGLADAFSSAADFSGMDGQRDLFISAIIHKAFVEVNEEGTEAAAATGTVMLGHAVMKPRPVPVFRADHPFIFLIKDGQTGSILFLGRITDPTK
jgi:serpin B